MASMKPFVRVVGSTLLTACAGSSGPPGLPGNPPEPEPTLRPVEPGPVQEPLPIPEVGGSKNPPAPEPVLPQWGDVGSPHPPGATNPPYPVLLVASESRACFKAWVGGMIPPSARAREAGGLVVETETDVSENHRSATRIQCPEGQPSELLGKWAASAPKE